MQNLFSCPIIVDELSASEKKYNLLASKEQLLELKEIFKVPNITKFQAVIFVKYNKKNHNLEVWGNVEASFVLQSVISLDLFDKTYVTEFSINYDTKASQKDIKELDFDFEDDEPYVVIDGKIDLADVAIEQISLIMDDNPRKDGEVFEFKSEFCEEDTNKLNPFSVLKNFKK